MTTVTRKTGPIHWV